MEEEGREGHTETMEIIKLASEVSFFGYINLGDLHSEKYYSLIELHDKISSWEKMGVDGIFIDEAGFEFWTKEKIKYRERLNGVLDLVHAKGLSAMVNAWIPEDIFSAFPKMPAHLQKGDSFLLESYVFSWKEFEFQYYRDRISVCNEAKKKLGVSIYGISITKEDPSDFTHEKWKYLTLSAHFDQIDGVAWAEKEFSSENSLLQVPPRDFLSVIVEKKGENRIDFLDETLQKSYIIGNDVHTMTLSYKNREIKEDVGKMAVDLIDCQDMK